MIRRSPRSTLVPFTTLFRSGACLVTYFKTRSLDVGMAGNGAIAGLVGITAPSGYVEFWAAPIIGLVAGVLVVFAVLADRKSTRLNSSHANISYAVFCLKNKR